MNTNTASIHLRGLIAAAVLGTLAVGFAGVSVAAGDPEARTETVHYADLNLSSPQGAAALYRRIRWAALNVCDSDNGSFGIATDMRVCEDKAIADAVTQVGRPELTAVYNANHREPLAVTFAALQPR